MKIDIKIKPEDVYIFLRCPDGRLELGERLDKRNLETWTNYWKDNHENWSEDTKYQNLREFLKIEGFEEWYDQEYNQVPNLQIFVDVMRSCALLNGNAFVLSMIYDLLSDEQKQKFYKKMKEKQK